MIDHPFTQSSLHKLAGILAYLLISLLICSLLVLYGSITFATAIADSLFYTCTLAIAAYFYWYVIGFFQVFQSQVVVTLAVQLICLINTLALLSLFALEDLNTFIFLIPIRMSVSTLTWIALQQWYNINKLKQQKEEDKTEQKEEEKSDSKMPEAEGSLDRISVKDGSKIHIIAVGELIYVQAYGDYVTLFTEKGKYIKELTMKYLEINLSDSFIRIHRSYIVNTNHIVRIELFGKETYQVRLKDGSCIRASSNGYKLLKNKLML